MNKEQTQNKLNILLVTGVVTSEHDPRVNPMLRRMLESTGRFTVKITEEFRGATAETLSHYDAVIVNYDGRVHTHTEYIGWGRNTEKAFYDFVASGKGAIIYHSSMIKGDPAMPEEFVRLVGCDFNFKNGGRKSPKLEFRVDVDNKVHPITRGLRPNWTTPLDDLFVNIQFLPDADITVLARVEDNAGDYDISKAQAHRLEEVSKLRIEELPGINTAQPVVWTNNYSKGRVFVVSIGHGPDTIRRPEYIAMFCRGAEWAATGEVTIDPPNLDNENRTRAWPYYTNISNVEYFKLTEY